MQHLFGKPRAITDAIAGRKISWLELFYDLIFSVVLARLTDSLVANFTWSGVGNAALVFAWFFWSWHETSGYFDNHGNDSIVNVLLINVQMILAGVTALYIPEAVSGNFARIRWGFALMEVTLIVIWRLIASFDAAHAPASMTWARVYAVVLVSLLLCFWFAPAWIIQALLVSAIINFGVVFFARGALYREYTQAGMDFVLKDSLIERYGLMTMIALGEIIASLFQSIRLPLTLAVLTSFIASIILVALITGVYYQVMGEIHVEMKSSVQVMAVRWLYLLDIYGVMMIGVTLHIALLRDHLLWRAALVAVLFATLWLMWLIQRVTQGRQPMDHAAWVMMLELPLMFLATLFSAIAMVIGLDVILAAVLVHYLFNRTARNENS